MNLEPGIRSRLVEGVNGLTMHVLEAGFESPKRPCLILLHGFPELAYSWRKVMKPLAAAGFHVAAPDRRGYGRTTGWDGDYDSDLKSFSVPNRVNDTLALVSALGYETVSAVIGHDFGSTLAGWCALMRPDVFRSVVMMSAPFSAPSSVTPEPVDLDAELANLPRPRKHYLRYYSTREANLNMRYAPQGVAAFLRAYYHIKSADWKPNNPFPLAAWTAEELAKLPPYYVMDLDQGMAETVAREMPSSSEVSACKWLSEDDLKVYASEYERTGFQGGLNEYRCDFDAEQTAELRRFCDRTIDVPSSFIGGRSDWGVFQTPGALEKMPRIELIDGAGHWVQQERPERVAGSLLRFLAPLNHLPPIP